MSTKMIVSDIEKTLIDQVCETMKLRAEMQEVVLGLVEISRQLDELINIQKAGQEYQRRTQERPRRQSRQ